MDSKATSLVAFFGMIVGAGLIFGGVSTPLGVVVLVGSLALAAWNQSPQRPKD